MSSAHSSGGAGQRKAAADLGNDDKPQPGARQPQTGLGASWAAARALRSVFGGRLGPATADAAAASRHAALFRRCVAPQQPTLCLPPFHLASLPVALPAACRSPAHRSSRGTPSQLPPRAAMDSPEPDTPFAAVTAQTTKYGRVR